MGTQNRTDKKAFAITFVLASLIIGLLSLLVTGFYFKSVAEKMATKNNQLDSLISSLQSNLDRTNKELETKKLRYDSFTEAENQLAIRKEEFFSLLSSLEHKIVDGQSDAKIAYLTFDDGPYYLSSSFLDVLDEYNVPASFFYLMKGWENGYGDADSAYDETYRRIIESGHTLCNHTATHKLGPDGIYRSVDAFMADLLRNRDFIQNRYNYTTDIMRFPGGSNTSSNIRYIIPEIVREGYSYIDWNSSCGDGGAVLSPEKFKDNILNYTNGRDILVVLMHDYSQNTLTALPEIIEGLAAQGYVFMPLFHDSLMCKTY